MERWNGRVAVVTGASAGLGADLVIELAKHGLVVVGLARREERVQDLIKALPKDCKGKIYPLKCDVSQANQVNEAFEWVDKNLGGVSILINNAGLLREVFFKGVGNPDGWKEILDTNVLGSTLCSRSALQNMIKYKITDGHFINMNSLCGHIMPVSQMLGCSMYYASKHANLVLTNALRKEILSLNLNIRVTSVSPGAVATEILDAAGTQLEEFGTDRPYLEAEHITSAVIYALSVPSIVNISEMVIQHVKEGM